MKPDKATPVRASIGFPRDTYEALDRLAREKRVSLAWIVRDAVERCVTERTDRSEQE